MITLDSALATARSTLATIAERAEQHGYYAGDRSPGYAPLTWGWLTIRSGLGRSLDARTTSSGTNTTC